MTEPGTFQRKKILLKCLDVAHQHTKHYLTAHIPRQGTPAAVYTRKQVHLSLIRLRYGRSLTVSLSLSLIYYK